MRCQEHLNHFTRYKNKDIIRELRQYHYHQINDGLLYIGP